MHPVKGMRITTINTTPPQGLSPPRHSNDQFGTLSIDALATTHGHNVHGYVVLSPSPSMRRLSSSSRATSTGTSPQHVSTTAATSDATWPELGLHPRRVSSHNAVSTSSSLHDQLTTERFQHSHAGSIATTSSMHQAQQRHDAAVQQQEALRGEDVQPITIEPLPLSPMSPSPSPESVRIKSNARRAITLDKYAASFYLRVSSWQLSQRLLALVLTYVGLLVYWSWMRSGHDDASLLMESFPWWTPVWVMSTVVVLHANKLLLDVAPLLGGRGKIILSCVTCNFICLLAYVISALHLVPVELDTRGRRFSPERFCEWLLCTPLLIALVANVSDYTFRADRHMIQVGGNMRCALASANPFPPSTPQGNYRLLEQPGYLWVESRSMLDEQQPADSRILAILWGLGGKRKRNGAAVVSKRAARSELTARLFLRFYPPDCV
jgi:hypothetical protein